MPSAREEPRGGLARRRRGRHPVRARGPRARRKLHGLPRPISPMKLGLIRGTARQESSVAARAVGVIVVQGERTDPAIRAVAALDDELRRGMYAFIRAARRPVTRDEAAAAVGISRKLAAFHLDKLVDAGVLRTAAPQAAAERKVGRKPKVYEPAGTDLRLSIPPRSPTCSPRSCSTPCSPTPPTAVPSRPRCGPPGTAATTSARPNASRHARAAGHRAGAHARGRGPATARLRTRPPVPHLRPAAHLPLPPPGHQGAGTGLRDQPRVHERRRRRARRRVRRAGPRPAVG